jgi:hypothetical protein
MSVASNAPRNEKSLKHRPDEKRNERPTRKSNQALGTNREILASIRRLSTDHRFPQKAGVQTRVSRWSNKHEKSYDSERYRKRGETNSQEFQE